MHTTLSPRQSALNVLEIAIDKFHKRPGEALPLMSMASAWDSVQKESNCFGDGINYALSMGWLSREQGPILPRITLTSAGFKRKYTVARSRTPF
ncbi:hypothetical protein KKF84_08255 [Myxococcota bacterium]|nr:hypothetical protein [Myxococcota bacterium]MBU1535300.1 hypothetical protein [Myxococcota bacterium]